MPSPVEGARVVGTLGAAALTIDELIAGATDRVEVHPEDGKSGAHFETLRIDGEPYFLKVLSLDGDWIMRCTGNTEFWEYKAWQAGLYDLAPPVIDHAMVNMTVDNGRLAMLLHDIGPHLIPEGDDVVSLDTHDRLLDHMAAFHAAAWGWRDDVGVSSIEQRLNFFSDENVAREMARGDAPGPILVAEKGWALLREKSPALADVVEPIRANPTAFADQLRALPLTFIMGDWKMGNIGEHPDGRTILLDWAYPGAAPGLWDLMWYVSVNRARLPRTKEESIAAYREGLERHGVSTAGWWDEALRLSLIAIMAMMAWEKAVGDADELAWWTEAVTYSGFADN